MALGQKFFKYRLGGGKMPSTEETAIMTEDGSGNFRSLDNLVMQGDKVFNFVLTEAPTHSRRGVKK